MNSEWEPDIRLWLDSIPAAQLSAIPSTHSKREGMVMDFPRPFGARSSHVERQCDGGSSATPAPPLKTAPELTGEFDSVIKVIEWNALVEVIYSSFHAFFFLLLLF